MMIRWLLVLLVIQYVIAGDESCRNECHTDRMPQCGVWLVKETNPSNAGTYELNTGMVNMTCMFSSLPTPASVTWLYKPPNSISWTDFSCSSKDETKQCRETEQTVTSHCLLRTNSLKMTGSYRCQGTTTEPSNKAISSEFNVDVVGIEKVEVTGHLLPYGRIGYIDVEICANPKPEVLWMVSDAVIRPDHGVGVPRMSAAHLSHKRVRSSRDGPVTIVPYCYVASLITRSVHHNDTFQLMIRGELDVKLVSLPVTITQIPRLASQPMIVSILYLLILEFFKNISLN